MRTKIFYYAMLLSGALFLLAGCNPPKDKTPDNQIIMDGRTYAITDAGTDLEGALWLWFEAADDVEASFALHMDDGDFQLSKSHTFVFAAEGTDDYGKSGTFSEGTFETKTGKANVVSGSINVVVSGETRTIKVDCACDGDRKLTVNYIGSLKYLGPIGTSTFNVGGVEFPYAAALIDFYEMDEDYGAYTTEIEIYASDITGGLELECYLEFMHSEPNLAGDYSCTTDEAIDTEIVYGTVYADVDGGGAKIEGFMSEGKVKVEIAGDIYTITLDGVKIDAGNGLVDMTGAYNGSVEEQNDDDTDAGSTRKISVKRLKK